MSNASAGFRAFAPLVLLAFVFITVPACVYFTLHPQALLESPVNLFYGALIVNSHFAVTSGMYAERGAIVAFGQSTARMLLFYAVPLVIMIFVCLLNAGLLSGDAEKTRDNYLLLVRLFNIFHFGRQSYGVLQLVKPPQGRSKDVPWVRKMESHTFTLLQLTLAAATIFPEISSTAILTCIAVSLTPFFIVLFAYYHYSDSSFGSSPYPALYLTFQVFSFLISIQNPKLFIYATAMHYLEYHVLIYLRFFESTSPWYQGGLRSVWNNKIVFYLATFNISAWATISMTIDKSSFGLLERAIIGAFDGIFLVHFFLETFLWRRRFLWRRPSL